MGEQQVQYFLYLHIYFPRDRELIQVLKKMSDFCQKWPFQAKNGPFRHVRKNYGSQRRFEAQYRFKNKNYTFLAQLVDPKIFGFRAQVSVRSPLQISGKYWSTQNLLFCDFIRDLRMKSVDDGKFWIFSKYWLKFSISYWTHV